MPGSLRCEQGNSLEVQVLSFASLFQFSGGEPTPFLAVSPDGRFGGRFACNYAGLELDELWEGYGVLPVRLATKLTQGVVMSAAHPGPYPDRYMLPAPAWRSRALSPFLARRLPPAMPLPPAVPAPPVVPLLPAEVAAWVRCPRLAPRARPWSKPRRDRAARPGRGPAATPTKPCSRKSDDARPLCRAASAIPGTCTPRV